MARTQTMVQLTDDLITVLDGEAARRGVSRSALIRELLETALEDAREADLGWRIVDGYRRVPPATPEEWGSQEAAGDTTTRDLLARLDREEADAGLGEW